MLNSTDVQYTIGDEWLINGSTTEQSMHEIQLRNEVVIVIHTNVGTITAWRKAYWILQKAGSLAMMQRKADVVILAVVASGFTMA